MILSERNRFFKAAGYGAAAFLFLGGAGTWLSLREGLGQVAESAIRAHGLGQMVFGRFSPRPDAVVGAILLAAAYAVGTLAGIYRYFRNTNSPEIWYIALFTCSFALEPCRLLLPLGVPGPYLIIATRFLLFARYFGLCALLTASLAAVKLEVQNQRNSLFIIILAALTIAIKTPIDGLTWDSAGTMLSGYAPMFRVIEIVAALLTTVTFWMAAPLRGNPDYIGIGVSALFLWAGRNLLLSTDTWPALVVAAAFLIGGVWEICRRLHRVYLWL